jgi:catechol-2,3-dioxygenase
MPSTPWPLRDLTLKVLDLPNQISVYKQFGFRELTRSSDSATLAAGDGARLTLQSLPNLQPRPPLAAGLFHFAILVSRSPNLGSFLRYAMGRLPSRNPPRPRASHRHQTRRLTRILRASRLTANWGPFRFLSFDGYYHHLAINLAAGHNAAPVPQRLGPGKFLSSTPLSPGIAPIPSTSSSPRLS